MAKSVGADLRSELELVVSSSAAAMHALVAATLGYGSTHKEPFDKLEKGGTLLWPGQSDQVLRNDASGSTVEVSAPADAAWGEHATTGGRFTGAHRRRRCSITATASSTPRCDTS